MNKPEALKLIADYGRAVCQTAWATNGPKALKAFKNENKHVRKLLKAIGITEKVTDEEISNS